MKLLHLSRYNVDTDYTFSRYCSIYKDSIVKADNTNRTLLLSNGLEIKFGFVDKEEGAFKFGGITTDFIIFDDNFPDDVNKYLVSRVRNCE